MSADAHTEPQKTSAVLYLSSNRPLHLPDFLAEFHKNWPLGLLEKTGKELHRAFFRAGRSNFALELHHTPVPQALSGAVIHNTLHWPNAAEALSSHPAYLSATGSPGNGGVLTLASDLTKAIAALVFATDALAVCWLNGPALTPARKFAETAREMFDTGIYPLALWVAVRFDAEADALYTKGMMQFAAPEIYLARQPDPAPLMVDYLLQVAQYVLTSHHQIKDGEKMDSPHGIMRIKSTTSGGQDCRRVLILEPLDR
ncbi:MAG TPA: hypothetical protein VEK84_16390 [Terriglobales bacterium]|nr:hypothetical protein [Terriglobales bacterium]